MRCSSRLRRCRPPPLANWTGWADWNCGVVLAALIVPIRSARPPLILVVVAAPTTAERAGVAMARPAPAVAELVGGYRGALPRVGLGEAGPARSRACGCRARPNPYGHHYRSTDRAGRPVVRTAAAAGCGVVVVGGVGVVGCGCARSDRG